MGSNNIDIGNSGYSTDTGIIRIGTKNTRAYIAGISGKTALGGVQVFVNTNGQLGTLTSSRRFKKDIRTISFFSDKLLQLNPVSFRYKEAAPDGTYPVQYGLIAEEVAKVYPDLVQYDKEGKPFTVYYHLLAPLMLSELKKEHQLNVTQQAELASFKQKDIKQQAQLARVLQLVASQQVELASFKQTIKQLTHLVQTGNSAILSRPQVRNVKL